MDGKAEMLDHHEGCKDHEDLPPRPGHELQRIIQPVAPPQDQPVMLANFHRKHRIGYPAIYGDGDSDPAPRHIDLMIAKPAPFEDNCDQPVCNKRCC